MIAAAVDNTSRPDAGAKRLPPYCAMSLPCARHVARECGGIRVIVDLGANVEGTLDFRGEGKIVPARQIRRIEDNTPDRVEWAWRADSDSCEGCACLGPFIKDGVDGTGKCRKSGHGIFAGRHSDALPKEDCAVCVDKAGGTLSAADIR